MGIQVFCRAGFVRSSRRLLLTVVKHRSMKRTVKILTILIALTSLNTAEGQPLPIRMGYSILGSAMSPVWMAKELGLFERHGLHSGPIYMTQTVAYRAMLAGETDFTGGGGLAPIQARLSGALIQPSCSPILVASASRLSPAHRSSRQAISRESFLALPDLELPRTSPPRLPSSDGS